VQGSASECAQRAREGPTSERGDHATVPERARPGCESMPVRSPAPPWCGRVVTTRVPPSRPRAQPVVCSRSVTVRPTLRCPREHRRTPWGRRRLGESSARARIGAPPEAYASGADRAAGRAALPLHTGLPRSIPRKTEVRHGHHLISWQQSLSH
jgi:hypothetical protein